VLKKAKSRPLISETDLYPGEWGQVGGKGGKSSTSVGVWVRLRGRAPLRSKKFPSTQGGQVGKFWCPVPEFGNEGNNPKRKPSRTGQDLGGGGRDNRPMCGKLGKITKKLNGDHLWGGPRGRNRGENGLGGGGQGLPAQTGLP